MYNFSGLMGPKTDYLGDITCQSYAIILLGGSVFPRFYHIVWELIAKINQESTCGYGFVAYWINL